ncbi:hypothetical protein F4779DRAFT_351086 [Xylariaceae sp. FL0662B]|nr:hypothetical protein F4779DRAFT_351086 [Xylariaceae sp. FL0662B]
MDDTTNLVSELTRKLADLDHKVCEYRYDMAQEFRRYSQDLLGDVPDHVSTKVEKIIADKLQNYPALSPDLHPALGSLSPDNAGVTTPDDKKFLSLNALPHVSDLTPDEGPRSPHEREREFHGLFTPSYLPLLDAVQRHNLAPTTPSSPPLQPLENKSARNDQGSYPNFLTPAVLPRPDPTRRHTGDTISSAASDDSSRVRRSALRRSSSSSTKTQSPRRVRFDVEGQEVLPTASPPGSPRASDIPPSPLGNPIGLLDESPNATVIDGESTLLGSSPPMPKKITSTERLKAMARNSTEDTSSWEVVGNLGGTDDEEDEDELVMASLKGRKRNGTPPVAARDPSSKGPTHRINDTHVLAQPKGLLEVVEETGENEAAEETDESDDMAEMPQLCSFKNRKRFSPPPSPAPESDSSSSGAQGSKKERIPPPNSIKFHTEPDFDEDMFEFDESQESTLDEKSGKARPIKYIDEEEEDEVDTTPIAEDPIGGPSTSLYSTSPAIPIAKPTTPPPASTPSRHVSASVGSYRGKPFSIEVVRNDELHKKAAEMGDFYTFVGSVDGRSGVDETSSYRPELTYFNGTPRSLSERLMKEDWDDARRNSEANKQA